MKEASRPSFLLLMTLALAGTGQFFLAQQGKAPTLLWGLVFYALACYCLSRALPVPPGRPEPSPSKVDPQEAFLYFPILGLAVLFRFFGESPLSDGVFADRAEVALGALRILNEGWRPGLSALDLHVPELPIYYMAAAWFKLFGSSPTAYAFFDATLSLLGVLGFYRIFRQVSGPWVALAGFFLLSVMRWNFVFGRQVYFQTQTVLFTAIAVLFLLRALRGGGKGNALAAGAFAGLGLYAYQALKALPLFFLAWTLHSLLTDKEGFRVHREKWTTFWACFLLFSLPYLAHLSHHEGLGRREAEVSVMVNIRAQGSLRPLYSNFLDAAGMFNRRGDDNAQSNFDAHRMLDDATGVLFLLGLFHALRRLKHQAYFLAVAGLLVFSLPAVFSINGAHAGRMLGATPFVAWLCGLLVRDAFSLFPSGRGRWMGLVLLGALAGASATQNALLYFQAQAKDPDYRSDFSWEESKVGRWVGEKGGDTEFFLASRFFGHPSVRYLARENASCMHPLDLSDPPQPGKFRPGKAFQFLLDERKAGVVEYLSALYPGGTVEASQNPAGNTPLYSYRVGPEALGNLPVPGPKVERGLRGVYHRMDLEGDPVLVERWDPVINFSFRDLPGLPAPLKVRWSGRFQVGARGDYSFLVLTYEQEQLNQARLGLDGNLQTPFMACPTLRTALSEGWHDLVLEYRKPEGALATVNLLWKRPGMDRYEFMPNSVFGPIQ